jgi:putative membrane protein
VHPLVAGAALVAAALHAWFFVLESVLFERPSVWRRFGMRSQDDVRVARSFAYNQGFYNLFLALGAALGVVLAFAGDPATGRPIMLFACGSMVAAGVVLVTHNPRFLRAAVIQIVPPLVAISGQLLFAS